MRRRTIIALLVAVPLGIATLQMESLTGLGESLILPFFPGILGAMILSGNVHAFPLWIASIVNFIFYFGLAWAMGYFWHKARRKPKVEERSGDLEQSV